MNKHTKQPQAEYMKDTIRIALFWVITQRVVNYSAWGSVVVKALRY